MTYSTTVSDHSVNYGPANWEKVNTFPVRLRNRLISTGLVPVQSHTENDISIVLQKTFHKYKN